MSAPTTTGYAFDNDDPDATDRHTYLPTMLDEFTTSRLCGLGALTGRRCLELGAGGGSIAAWLADRVGTAGHVLATDINVRHLPTGVPYEVLRHDLATEPVPAGSWDLIHARLLLLHLPQRREIVHRLVAALAPGGALVLEDFASSLGEAVLAAPDERGTQLCGKYQDAMQKILPARGSDPGWAGRVPAILLEEGLVEVDTVAHARSWPGGTAGALLMEANIRQLRPEFVAAGMAAAELDELCRLVHDPRLVVRGPITYSTIGRRPVR